MKSLLWEALFCLLFLLWMLLYILYIVTKLFLPRKISRRFMQLVVGFWAKTTILSTGSKVKVSGKEYLPAGGNICFVSNHQGLFDIPLILGFLEIHPGFIAKRELFKIPILSQWMREMPCTFIDRRNPRKAMQTIKKSAELIKKGNPMVIFPEGTRSKSNQIGDFHLGSLKLPVMAEATIVPLAIKGSWQIFEKDNKIRPATVYLNILPPVKPEDEIYKDQRKLAAFLRSSISQALEEGS